jgi:hypothetical protein
MRNNLNVRWPEVAADTGRAESVTLELWALSKFAPTPHPNTLRAWARDGKIIPQPNKIGRSYFVHPQAQHINELFQNRLADRI